MEGGTMEARGDQEKGTTDTVRKIFDEVFEFDLANLQFAVEPAAGSVSMMHNGYEAGVLTIW